MNLVTIFQTSEIMVTFNLPARIVGFTPEGNYFLMQLVAAMASSEVTQRYPQILVDIPVITRFFINCH